MVAVLLVLASVASVVFAVRQPVGIAMFFGLLVGFVCGALACVAVVLTVGFFRLRYRFGSGGLGITWLGRQELVPYDQVDSILAGQRLGQAMRVRGLNWPGFHVGVGRTRAMGFVRYFVTTGDLNQIALIVTPEVTIAVSPADAAGFRRELIARVEASDAGSVRAPAVAAEDEARPPSPLRDLSLGALVLASIAILGLTLLYISVRWAGIPDALAMQFTRDGEVVAYGQREDIFKLPGIGAAILVANLGIGLSLYARERAAARMLWAVSVVVQVLVLVATARILH